MELEVIISKSKMRGYEKMKKGMLYVLITAVLFVTYEPISKIVAGDVNPYAITFWRFAMASLIMLPPTIVKIKKEKIRISIKDFAIMTGLGVLFICLSMITLQIGVKKADSPSLIAIIFSSNSVFTILFSMLILKDKLTLNKAIALVLGMIGVIACADFSSGTNIESVFFGVFSAVSFSLYTALSQKFMKKFGGMVQASIVFLMGSVVLLVALLIGGVNLTPSFNFQTIGIMLYIGFCVTGIGYVSYFKAIEKGGAIMASLAFFIKPILTPFVAFFINGVVPDAKVYVAIICIVAASYLATYSKLGKN